MFFFVCIFCDDVRQLFDEMGKTEMPSMISTMTQLIDLLHKPITPMNEWMNDWKNIFTFAISPQLLYNLQQHLK